MISTMVEFWDAGECGAGVKVGNALATRGDAITEESAVTLRDESIALNHERMALTDAGVALPDGQRVKNDKAAIATKS